MQFVCARASLCQCIVKYEKMPFDVCIVVCVCVCECMGLSISDRVLDDVKFGEVALQPPTLSAKPRHTNTPSQVKLRHHLIIFYMITGFGCHFCCSLETI